MRRTFYSRNGASGGSELFEILTDGSTVWVSTPEVTIGRFSRRGVDVHSRVASLPMPELATSLMALTSLLRRYADLEREVFRPPSSHQDLEALFASWDEEEPDDALIGVFDEAVASLTRSESE